ncbi:protein yecM [Yersinia enterocolitica]|uniref:VOC family protein n=1 Tax=Yersinia enterocolitica TaxID=630 RepID=UPI0005E06E5E|nr:VOC family protein [Yersinia enterocolitica]CNF37463.1 protein yecM [Yersinia enterocolitica]
MSSLKDIVELPDLLTDLPYFAQKLVVFAAKLNLDLTQFSADHISLRCHQTQTAQRWRSGLQQCGNLMSETQINGRAICLFDLTPPLVVGPWQIDCVELPYPGKTYYPHEGWEHVELVLPGDPQTLMQRARALLPTTLPEGVTTKFSSPQGEHERLANPTFAVSDGEITIKFHPYTLRQIVDSERNS